MTPSGVWNALPVLPPAAAWGVAGVAVLALALLVVATVRLVRTRRRSREHAGREDALRQRLEAVTGTADGIGVTGPGGRFVYANEGLAALLDHPGPDRLFGRSWRSLFASEDVRVLERDAVPAARREGVWRGGAKGVRSDGEEVELEISVTALADGGLTWILREEPAEETGFERYRTLFRTAGSALVLLSPAGEVVEWNREAARLHGEARDPRGHPFVHLFVPPADRDRVGTELGRVSGGDGRRTFEVAAPGEEDRHILWNVSRFRTDGDRAGLLAVGQDITERVRAEEALERQESLYRLLAHNSSDLVALHHPDGRFEYVSPSCQILLGQPPAELVGKDLYQLTHSDDWRRVQAALAAVESGRPSRISCRFRSATGEYVWFETLLRPIRDAAGTLVQVQSASRDVSERKAFEEQLRHQALHEPLTGLPNRTLFLDRLGHALARSRREKDAVGVMFLDLDRFKVVNDSLGHAAGDRLLTAVARRITSVIREADTVARLGGDEFGILLEFDIARRDAGAVAERILGSLRPPFHVAGTEVFIEGSIGVAFDRGGEEGPEDLLRFADVAMYRAKDEGGGWRVYDPEVDRRATRRLEMETALRRALEREQFLVMYQPIVALSTGGIAGFEALVRWRHPEWGLVGPGEFIPLAEESGLIVPIGAWILQRACAQAAAWGEAAGVSRPISVSVNLSARQFEHPELTDTVSGALEASGLEPGLLHLEITESELIQRRGRVEDLKALGVRVSIDDFGTGFSSLSYLKDLDVDELKIDRSFVQGLDRSGADAAIVRTVVTLANALGLAVTAEGIETEVQLQRLRELECDRGQGYHFARPMEAEEAEALLAREPRW